MAERILTKDAFIDGVWHRAGSTVEIRDVLLQADAANKKSNASYTTPEELGAPARQALDSQAAGAAAKGAGAAARAAGQADNTTIKAPDGSGAEVQVGGNKRGSRAKAPAPAPAPELVAETPEGGAGGDTIVGGTGDDTVQGGGDNPLA